MGSSSPDEGSGSRGGLARCRNLVDYSRKQFVSCGCIWLRRVYLLWIPPPSLTGKLLTYLCKSTVQTQPGLFCHGHLIVIRAMRGMIQWWFKEHKRCRAAIVGSVRRERKSCSVEFVVMKWKFQSSIVAAPLEIALLNPSNKHQSDSYLRTSPNIEKLTSPGDRQPPPDSCVVKQLPAGA